MRISLILMHNRIYICLIAFFLFPANFAFASDSADLIKQRISSGNPLAGKTKSTLCQSCHGEDGLSIENLIPHLAGQYSRYIIKQLRNFQTGTRKHEIMGVMSKTIHDFDLADIAAYFASQPKMRGGGWGDNPVGKNLFQNGDKARDIPACVSCHGINGKGKAPNISTYPVIGGQHKAYLNAQLLNWRNGQRTNSQNGAMNRIAKSLTDSEIDALADYLSGL